ncbi:MAG TPA: DUF6438 domain-containing protein [Gemmatimonadaceae bacterium]|nr:DUF6438 domain-containing protein [Gemmatimonadaceae bacterium]
MASGPAGALLVAALLLTTACRGRATERATGRASRPTAGDTTAWATNLHDLDAADSVVLERTLCYGSCPAYRLAVARSGAVRFESRNPQDSGRAAADSVDPRGFGDIMTDALFVAFLDLPDRIADDERMCGPSSTDAPTAIVTLYLPGGRRKRVQDYQGCHWAPWQLHALEDRIDSVAGSARWVRSARWP